MASLTTDNNTQTSKWDNFLTKFKAHVHNPFYKRVDTFEETVQKGYDYVIGKATPVYNQIAEKVKPMLSNPHIRAISLIALTILATILSPIGTLTGIALGIVFQKRVLQVLDRLHWENTTPLEKILIVVTGVLTAGYLPLFVSGITVGALAGSQLMKTLSETTEAQKREAAVKAAASAGIFG